MHTGLSADYPCCTSGVKTAMTDSTGVIKNMNNDSRQHDMDVSNRTATILVIEDEPEIAELLATHIRNAGYLVRVMDRGLAGMTSAQNDRPDLILLDLMLPDVDGLEVCRELQREALTASIPIIMVSARGEESDIVEGLELGASDYVTKPFSSKVLLARIQNILRRSENTVPATGSGEVVNVDGIVIDNDRHEVRIDDKIIDLTLSEYEILHYLARRPSFVRTRDQIISALHGDRVVMSRRTIDVHVTALRRKLGAHGGHIETVRGVGYRLNESVSR